MTNFTSQQKKLTYFKNVCYYVRPKQKSVLLQVTQPTLIFGANFIYYNFAPQKKKTLFLNIYWFFSLLSVWYGILTFKNYDEQKSSDIFTHKMKKTYIKKASYLPYFLKPYELKQTPFFKGNQKNEESSLLINISKDSKTCILSKQFINKQIQM